MEIIGFKTTNYNVVKKILIKNVKEYVREGKGDLLAYALPILILSAPSPKSKLHPLPPSPPPPTEFGR
jgi:hypothetical protein